MLQFQESRKGSGSVPSSLTSVWILALTLRQHRHIQSDRILMIDTVMRRRRRRGEVKEKVIRCHWLHQNENKGLPIEKCDKSPWVVFSG